MNLFLSLLLLQNIMTTTSLLICYFSSSLIRQITTVKNIKNVNAIKGCPFLIPQMHSSQRRSNKEGKIVYTCINHEQVKESTVSYSNNVIKLIKWSYLNNLNILVTIFITLTRHSILLSRVQFFFFKRENGSNKKN